MGSLPYRCPPQARPTLGAMESIDRELDEAQSAHRAQQEQSDGKMNNRRMKGLGERNHDDFSNSRYPAHPPSENQDPC